MVWLLPDIPLHLPMLALDIAVLTGVNDKVSIGEIINLLAKSGLCFSCSLACGRAFEETV